MIETKAGMGIGAFGNDDAPKAKLLSAIAWVIKRRDDPSYKYDQAKELTMAEATAILGKEEATS